MAIKLRYLKGSKEMGKDFNIDTRLWDVLEPKLPNYVYSSDSHIPTFSTAGLKENGLIK